MLAIDLVSTLVPTLHTSDTLRTAAERMRTAHLSHLPIVNDAELLGVLSGQEIMEAEDPEQSVGSIRISLLLSFVSSSQHVYDALGMMADQKLSMVPVVDDNKNYLGSVTQDGLLEYCSLLTSGSQPGGIIILEMNERDLSMSEIARIVESNNARILSYFTESSADSSTIMLTLKLNKTDITAILATFERFNYQVKISFQPDNFKDDTLGRYESFMNYLNM